MIDREKLKRTLDCDDEFLDILFDQFVLETKESTKNLNRSLEDKNWAGVRGSAHKMLSSTKMLGLPELSGLLERIEEYSASGKELESLPGLVQKYSNGIEEVYSEIGR